MTKIKHFVKSHKLFISQIIIIFFLIISLILLAVLKTNQDICEKWTRSIGRFHSSLFGHINQIIPFSITELSIILIVIGIILLLIFAIINFSKKQIWPAVGKLSSITIILLSIFTVYNVTFEMAYNRKPLEISLYEEKVEEEKYYQIVDYFIDDINYCISNLSFDSNGDVINPYNNKQLNNILRDEYEKITSDYYSSYTPRVKQMMTSFLYTTFGITGWYFAPMGEATCNYLCTNSEKPMCFAHEMAHSKGVASEDDAQLLAAFICLNSSDCYVRYSGYINVFSSILQMANFSNVDDAYKTLYSKVDTKLFKQFKYINDYWKKNAIMINLGTAINNWYLKKSGQKEGTGSYQDTPAEIDEHGKVITLSTYQKLVVEIYHQHFPSEL